MDRLRQLTQDIRYALRGFRKAPLFTAVAIVSLALGIGANTAIFSLIHQLILKPLPIRDPQSVVLLAGVGRHYGSNNGRNALSYPMYQDFRDRNQVFSGMMCRYSMTATVGVSSQSEAVGIELVSGNYFPMLGIGAAAGRVFTANDDLHAGAHPWAVLSNAYWRSRFAADPRAIGQTIRLNNYPLTIVGVLKPGFDGMEPGLPAEIFVPIMMAQSVRPSFTDMFNRRQRWVNVFGRLKPGFDIARAKAGMQPLFHQIIDNEVLAPAFRTASPQARQAFLRMSINVMPGSQGNSYLRRTYEKPLLVLMGVVALVLLIACANLASLYTARATARRKEIAIRLAMGSTRGRLIRQLLAESMLLSIAGAAAGAGLAVVMVKALLGFLPVNITGYNISATPDTTALAFTAGLAVLAGLMFGLAPALQSTKPDIAPTLKDEAGSVASAGIGFRKVLVAVQVTFSLILLIGAGVFVRSLAKLQLLDPGFRTRGLVQFTLNPRFVGYDPDRASAFFRRLDESLAGIPGVRADGMADVAILAGNEWDMWVTIEGYTAASGEPPDVHFNAVTPGYFDALGIHVIAGRGFRVSDDQTAPKVAVVNSTFAKRYFGNTIPVGRHFGVGGDPGTRTDIQIAGVVNDTRYESFRDEIPPQIFLPQMQRPAYGSRTVYVRSERDSPGTFMAIRSSVRELDPNIPVVNMKTFERQINESLITERMIATLAGLFGILATALALIGLYGVMSFTVTRRSREIGIRMSLGAMRENVVWLIMREALLLIAAGILIGLPAAYALTRLVRAQLYGIDPGDPASIVLATLLLAAVTAVAGYVPARRAASFNPLRVLRHE